MGVLRDLFRGSDEIATKIADGGDPYELGLKTVHAPYAWELDAVLHEPLVLLHEADGSWLYELSAQQIAGDWSFDGWDPDQVQRLVGGLRELIAQAQTANERVYLYMSL